MKAKKYLDLGVQIIFPIGLKTVEKTREIFAEIRNREKNCFLFADGVEIETKNKQSLKEIGINCIIYPEITLSKTMEAIDNFLDDLIENGSQKGYITR